MRRVSDDGKKRTETIPAARAFGRPAQMTLDEHYAMDRFLGKSRQEAHDMLKADFCYYEEDLACMGAGAFCYYVLAVQDLADDCLSGDPMEGYGFMDQILNMLGIRYTLYHANKKEPLDSILGLLETCKRFCNQTFPDSLHAPSLKEIAALGRRIDRLERVYLPAPGKA